MPSSPFWTLAVETSTLAASVCVLEDNEIVVETTVRTGRGHASKLLPSIESALEEAAVSLADLSLLVVPTGPGSFTGIRIGLSTVKALAWSSGTPAVGISSLEALAAGVGPASSLIASVIDARKGEVFTALYRPVAGGGLESIGNALVAKPERALVEIDALAAGEPVVFVGNGLSEYPEWFGGCARVAPFFDRVRAAPLGHLGLRAYRKNGAQSLPEIQPIYLRRSDAEIQVGAPTGQRETVVLQGK